MVTPSFPTFLQGQKHSAKKGTIVCDASALRMLMITFPQEKIIDESVRRTPLHSMLGALAFLATHGYEVVIPEMVAHEMGSFMRDGKSYHLEYLESNDEDFHKRMTYRSFFREIARLEAAGVPIHIQPPLPDNTSPEAQHVNRVYEVHRSNRSSIEKTELLEKLHWSGIRRESNAGDKEIISYIQSTDDGTSPIFILTNDGTLQHSFPKQRHISALGTAAFVTAFNSSHLLPSCGIHPISADNYTEMLHQRHGALTKEERAEEEQIFSGIRSRTDTFSGEPWNIMAQPFTKAMKKLAKELHVIAPATTVKATEEIPTQRVNQPHPQGIVLPHIDFSKIRISR